MEERQAIIFSEKDLMLIARFNNCKTIKLPTKPIAKRNISLAKSIFTSVEPKRENRLK